MQFLLERGIELEKRFYVIHNDDTNCEIVVKLTDNEANAIRNFIDWALLDTYLICPVDEWDADDWGKNVYAV